jgi:hypothetical protein
LINQVRKNFNGGFIEGTIQWAGQAKAIHPYMSAYTTMACLDRSEDEQVVEDFYWYLLHSTATHAFPEGVYYETRTAWNNTIPHCLGAANYAIMLRHMLIHEHGDELHLLKAVPDWWLDEGKKIRIERAPTHFGTMNLTITGTKTGVDVEFDPPNRLMPKRIFIYLPGLRQPDKPVKGVDVVIREEQKKRWDFPTVVKIYHQLAAN